jgi:hypothetical protein
MWAAESQDRAVLRIALTEDERRVVSGERDSHENRQREAGPGKPLKLTGLFPLRWLRRCRILAVVSLPSPRGPRP